VDSRLEHEIDYLRPTQKADVTKKVKKADAYLNTALIRRK